MIMCFAPKSTIENDTLVSLKAPPKKAEKHHIMTGNNPGFAMRPGIILLREGTDTSQVRAHCKEGYAVDLASSATHHSFLYRESRN
jgi:hypothetical protein